MVLTFTIPLFMMLGVILSQNICMKKNLADTPSPTVQWTSLHWVCLLRGRQDLIYPSAQSMYLLSISRVIHWLVVRLLNIIAKQTEVICWWDEKAGSEVRNASKGFWHSFLDQSPSKFNLTTSVTNNWFITIDSYDVEDLPSKIW